MTPDEIAAHVLDLHPGLRKQWADVRGERSEREQTVMVMRREGKTRKEIALALGVDITTVKRMLQRLNSDIPEPPSAHAQRVAVVAQMDADGWSIAQIAENLGVTTRQVSRLRYISKTKAAEAAEAS
jgi:DNA-binding NarL/FixJ family response regulator